MTPSSIIRNAALSTQLQTIPVSELMLGMVIHAIAEQSGSLGVKSKGEIKHLWIVDQLTASGVTSVVVELPKDKKPNKPGARKDSVTEQTKVTVYEEPSIEAVDACVGKLEFDDATNLLKLSETIYNRFITAIQQNRALDFSQTTQLVDSVYNSLAKEPDALLCMSMIMHSSDYIANHSIHVATLICHFALQIGMSKQDCKKLTLVGYLFDIGMLKVPLEIRRKQDSLTEIELEESKLHVSYSLSMLAPLKLDQESLLAVEQHHERLDESGYPYGFSGSKIHKFSRMLAIVDCYDALTSPREHQAPMAPVAAMKVLRNSENGYDQKLVIQFIRCMGIYPVGSLVLLSDKSIGLVTKTNHEAADLPEVKVFYSTSGGHFLLPEVIDLNYVNNSDYKKQSKHSGLRVLKSVLASQFDLSMAQFV
jgi:HD-GYP domain-containing protein (c-di-GMP phosphodiesterase class II)